MRALNAFKHIYGATGGNEQIVKVMGRASNGKMRESRLVISKETMIVVKGMLGVFGALEMTLNEDHPRGGGRSRAVLL